MSVQTELAARTAQLRGILSGANIQLAAKGGTAAGTLDDLPGRIAALPEGSAAPDLEAITVTPTGETFTKYPSGDGFSRVTVEGDKNLKSSNVVNRKTIYGVEGSAAGGPVPAIPSEWQSYVTTAATTLYTGDYAAIAVLVGAAEDTGDTYTTVAFLRDDFAVTDYDEATTKMVLTGCYLCQYDETAGTWTHLDYTSTSSPALSDASGHYAKHIVYSERFWVCGDATVYPQPAPTLVTAISFAGLSSGTFAETLAGGATQSYTVTTDDSGRVASISDGANAVVVEWPADETTDEGAA